MTELLFVYNADSGVVNGLLDSLHKTLSPATYACSLCAITYGTTSMRPQWRKFLKSLPVRATFLHRNELARRYPALLTEPLPAVFQRDNLAATDWQVVIAAAELSFLDLPGLIQLVRQRLPVSN
ncbi:hypothetical protein MUN84_01395 [Hymenobacter sp. 5516J-16]|uniref:hypothetical protein n=1 Tax=Hymenobacter sp. 5516J-16 TaxID=2932253 RepID=UPI001FD20266|nr:hypothetical protein [Hymenobacter sp. 5516J-16]UOQ77402.1 hypothetical protein MUN84_01395 [Hymenobacter sp. 5516J-16]